MPLLPYREPEKYSNIEDIEKIFRESDKTYGYRAIRAELKKQGIELSEYRVRKIMRENGFYPETRKKYRPSHNGKTDGRYHANHLKQKFKVEKKNQVWVGDITYIKTEIGWVYLAAVIDLYNREVIGYALSKKNRYRTGETGIGKCNRPPGSKGRIVVS